MSPKKVLCFGELLLRMSPSPNGGWITEYCMPVYIGGAELNVASALARWNIPVGYCTVLPDHALSHDLISHLQKKNIDTSAIGFSGHRLGIYFLSQGDDLKHTGVIYDRDYSSFSGLKPGMVDWDKVLKDVGWLHLSAINPALNQNVTEVCVEAVKAATGKGITISLDLNYRSRLWKYGKLPVQVMPELVQHCDVVMGNIWAAEDLLGIRVDTTILQDRNRNACIEHAEHTSRLIMKSYPKVKTVANTFRFDRPGNTIHYFATIYDSKALCISREFNACGIKDKIGSGDCFMAGLIYGALHQWVPVRTLNFSAAAAVGKMYETSDATTQAAEQILLNAANSWIKHG